MKHRFYLALATLIFFIFGCSEETKNKESNQIEQDMSTEPPQTKTTPKKITKSAKPIEEYKYTFQNLQQQDNVLHVINDVYNFKNIKQPIVIVTLMSTWCPPCRGQIPHLSKLQQKFKDNVFVIATLVHDDINLEALEKFITTQKMFFYVSITQEENLRFTDMLMPKLGLSNQFPMPLTLVFVKGKYFTHYEGMIPEEMIESDINQLLQKINK
jgi:thiol-disulfide isomerase/thioredoxin